MVAVPVAVGDSMKYAATLAPKWVQCWLYTLHNENGGYKAPHVASPNSSSALTLTLTLIGSPNSSSALTLTLIDSR